VSVPKPRACPTLARTGEQRVGVIDAVDVEAGFSKEMRVPTLTTRDVEHTGADGEAKDLEDAANFLPIAAEAEKRFVFMEVAIVEERCPPLASVRTALAQKKTGSRYAPKTASIAALIS
jgi:hypothetical protein